MKQCLPCEAQLRKLKSRQEQIDQAKYYAQNDATLTGHKSYRVIELPSGKISWRRSDQPSDYEAVEYLYFD